MYPFNVRTYGILIHESRILLSDEYFHDTYITKFPGGGLQFGEGTPDCLKREFNEELNLQIEIEKHFYTTDFFQPSAFDASKQIISIYYLVKPASEFAFNVSEKKFDFSELQNGIHSFRWMDLKNFSEDEMTFPIDKKVAGMIRQNFS